MDTGYKEMERFKKKDRWRKEKGSEGCSASLISIVSPLSKTQRAEDEDMVREVKKQH